MSFCWTRHRISLTNAEVAHNASLLLDKVTFHSSNAFLRSVFRSARLNTQKKKNLENSPVFFFFFLFLGVASCLLARRKRVEGSIILWEPKRSAEELYQRLVQLFAVLFRFKRWVWRVRWNARLWRHARGPAPTIQRSIITCSEPR